MSDQELLLRAIDIQNTLCKRTKKPIQIIESCRLFRDKNITFVLLNNSVMGWSKFNPNDTGFNFQAGVSRALSRAVRNLQGV